MFDTSSSETVSIAVTFARLRSAGSSGARSAGRLNVDLLDHLLDLLGALLLARLGLLLVAGLRLLALLGLLAGLGARLSAT